jgi:hypothetical protein
VNGRVINPERNKMAWAGRKAERRLHQKNDLDNNNHEYHHEFEGTEKGFEQPE